MNAAFYMHAECFIPYFRACMDDVSVSLDSSIAYQNMKSAVTLQGRVDSLPHAVFVAYITGK